VRRNTQLIRVLLSVIGLASASAFASTEPPGGYDGRSVAMGGTGAAYIHNAAAIYHNPAGLSGVERFAATVDLTGFSPRDTTPLNGDQTSVKSDFSVFPLFFVGAAYRLLDRVVVGVAAYPIGGFGSGYSKVSSLGGQDLNLGILFIETTPSVSIMVVDHFSVGLGYRITYARESSHGPAGPGALADQVLTGTNFAGLHAGLHYQPDPDWQFGLTYRSQVSTSLSGNTTVSSSQGTQVVPTNSSFSTPHAFRFGVSRALLDGKALLALDLKYLLYSIANKQIVVTTPNGSTTTPLNWKDVLSASLGAEYRLSDGIALRAGYAISQSATPDSTASYFTVPPGVINSFHAGVGFSYSNWDFDLGGLYAFVGKDNVQPSQAAQTWSGRYHLDTLIFALSASFHL
jgi:long-chain fatty acid transport protein